MWQIPSASWYFSMPRACAKSRVMRAISTSVWSFGGTKWSVAMTTFEGSQMLAPSRSSIGCSLRGPDESWTIAKSTSHQTISPGVTLSRPLLRARIFSATVWPTSRLPRRGAPQVLTRRSAAHLAGLVRDASPEEGMTHPTAQPQARERRVRLGGQKQLRRDLDLTLRVDDREIGVHSRGDRALARGEPEPARRLARGELGDAREGQLPSVEAFRQQHRIEERTPSEPWLRRPQVLLLHVVGAGGVIARDRPDAAVKYRFPDRF